MVEERLVRLIFPPALLNQPLLYQLIRKFEVQTNILEAQVTAGQGWLVLGIRGEQEMVRQGLEWLSQQGVQVVPVADQG